MFHKFQWVYSLTQCVGLPTSQTSVMIAMGFVVGAVFYQLDDRMFTTLGSFITDRWSELPDIDTDAVEPLTLGFGCYTEVA